ncbi:hypothetical protein B5S31_g2697 [[Candida] boidinii]|nr:hypothetical protein B5S31_g2697 [[Candida] boidinii]
MFTVYKDTDIIKYKNHNVLKRNGNFSKECYDGSPVGISDNPHNPHISDDIQEEKQESEFLSNSSLLQTKDVIGYSTLETLPGAMTPPPPVLHSIEEETVLVSSNLGEVSQHSLEARNNNNKQTNVDSSENRTSLAFLDQFQNDMMKELDSFYEDITQSFKETSTPERQTEVDQMAKDTNNNSISSQERLMEFLSEQMKHLSGNSPRHGSDIQSYGNKKRVKFALSDNVREISFHDYQGQSQGYSQSAAMSSASSSFTGGDSILERNKKSIIERRKRLKYLILKFHKEKREKGKSKDLNNDLIKCCSKRKTKSCHKPLVVLWEIRK